MREGTAETRKNLVRQQVAYLASEGLTQKKIASLLRLSQSSVSVLLQEAVSPPDGEELLLDPRPRFLGSSRVRSQVQNSLFLGDLQSRLNELGDMLGWAIIPTVHVGVADGNNQSWDNRVKNWGVAVAPTVVDLLQPCKTIVVSWGRQLRGLVEGIAAMQTERRVRDQAMVFACWPPRLSVRPESDDKVFRDHVALGANSLAFDLSVALNGESSRNTVAQNYLPGIDLIPFSDPPFVLDARLSPAETQAMLEKENRFLAEFKAALFQIPAYARIFGNFREHSNDSLLRKVDAAIFPSGPPGGNRSFAMGDNYGGIALEWFAKHALGDIGGVIIPAKENNQMSPAIALQFHRLRNHWLGVTEDDIAYIAKNGKVGTIVGAVGSDRVEAIFYGCRKQLIRHLVCDPSLAKSLADLVTNYLRGIRKERSRK